MQRVNVDISGEGPHTVIAAIPGKCILVHNFVLSFTHSFDESQPAVAMSGSDVIEGYLVYDGEKIFWRRDPSDTMRISPGEAFRITAASATGCTINAYQQDQTLLSLLGLDILTAGTTPINGATIRIMATEM